MRMSRQDQDGVADEEHIHKCGSARLEDELAADTLRELVRHASVLALLTRRGCGQGLELVAEEVKDPRQQFGPSACMYRAVRGTHLRAMASCPFLSVKSARLAEMKLGRAEAASARERATKAEYFMSGTGSES